MRLFNIFVSLVVTAMFANTVFADNKIVARVNGKPLTAFELNEEFQDLLPTMGAYHGGVTQEKIAGIRKKALDNLIEKELQYQYAVSKGISVSKKEIESEYAKMENSMGQPKKFKEALSESGITKNDLKEFIKKRLLIEKVKEQEVTSKARISDADLKAQYEKNREAYKRPVEFRASHILIGVDPAATKEEREKKLKLAKDILARIKAGEDFVKLAMRYSTDEGSAPIGGELGSFHKGMADVAIENAVLPLKVGEVSDVVETLYGYHIIKLTGLKPETQLSFDEMKMELKMKFEKKKTDELYNNWIGDLRAKAKIEYED